MKKSNNVVAKQEEKKSDITVVNPKFAGKKCSLVCKKEIFHDPMIDGDKIRYDMILSLPDKTDMVKLFIERPTDTHLNIGFANVEISDDTLNYPIFKDFIEQMNDYFKHDFWFDTFTENHEERSYLKNLF